MDFLKVLEITAALIMIAGVIFAGARWFVLQEARRQQTAPFLDPQPGSAPLYRLPQRRVRTLQWLVGGVLAVALIIGGSYVAATALGAGTRSPSTRVDVSNPTATVVGYFRALGARDYNTAWGYLAASRTDPGSKASFISTAQSQDDLLGKMTVYWITSTELESESRVTIATTIERSWPSYSTADVTFAVSQHGSSWLIESMTVTSTSSPD
jgi:hypothetical protein